MNIVIVWDDSYINGGNWVQPNWISIDSLDNSFSILLNQIQSFGAKHIKLQAFLVRK